MFEILTRLFKKKPKGISTKILIVEDNPKTQSTLRAILETQEAEIAVVDSGEMAFEYMDGKDFVPNVMVLDINLPGMNGGEVIKKMRMTSRYKNVPVVAFSSTWDERFDEPFEKDMEVVREFTDAANLSDKLGGGSVSSIIPKYQGQEAVDLVHPRLVVSVASTLLPQKVELSPSFQHLLYVSQKQIERVNQQRKLQKERGN